MADSDGEFQSSDPGLLADIISSQSANSSHPNHSPPILEIGDSQEARFQRDFDELIDDGGYSDAESELDPDELIPRYVSTLHIRLSFR